MAEAMAAGRKKRASKELALHGLDVLETMEASGRIISVRSTCEKPEPFYELRG